MFAVKRTVRYLNPWTVDCVTHFFSELSGDTHFAGLSRLEVSTRQTPTGAIAGERQEDFAPWVEQHRTSAEGVAAGESSGRDTHAKSSGVEHIVPVH